MIAFFNRMTALKPAYLFVLAYLAGCATPRFSVHAVAQDAPVQFVTVTPDRDNLLAHVLVRNMTDRAVEDFTIAWSVIQPKNCGAMPLHAVSIAGGARPAYAEGPGNSARALLPHEQTEITSLSMTREALEKMAQEQNIRRLRVQIIVAYVDFRPDVSAQTGFARTGPGWHSVKAEAGQPIFDPEDVAQQACAKR